MKIIENFKKYLISDDHDHSIFFVDDDNNNKRNLRKISEILTDIALNIYDIYKDINLFIKIIIWFFILILNSFNILYYIIIPILNLDIEIIKYIKPNEDIYIILENLSQKKMIYTLKCMIVTIFCYALFLIPSFLAGYINHPKAALIFDYLYGLSVVLYNMFLGTSVLVGTLSVLLITSIVLAAIICLSPFKYKKHISHETLTLIVIMFGFLFIFIIFLAYRDDFMKNFITYSTISLAFIILTHILCFICILLVNQSIKYKKKYYYALILLCSAILTPLFLTTDLIIFYILFELILLPIFFLIIIWGSRLRKLHAGTQFFLYTLIGSLLFLIGIIYLHINYNTTNLDILTNLIISKNDQIILWLLFFLAFAIKVPIYPFHLWLPEAHVEAPTTGSVLLAGILLKLGTYGFLVFFFYLLPYASIFFLPIINMLCILGIIYSSFAIIRQIDIKKIIAYSSVIHMNYTIIGLFNPTFVSFYGSFFLMLSHGIVSSALFICVGYLYERYHTRLIFYYGNVVMLMPVLSIYFLLFTLGNIGFPGTSSFVGEFLIFIGVFEINKFIGFLLIFGLFVSVIYSFLLYNKIFFFNSINQSNFFIKKFSDLNIREHFILFFLTILMFFYGIYTKSFYEYFYMDLNNLYYNSKYKLL